jgi:hypothetical protein
MSCGCWKPWMWWVCLNSCCSRRDILSAELSKKLTILNGGMCRGHADVVKELRWPTSGCRSALPSPRPVSSPGCPSGRSIVRNLAKACKSPQAAKAPPANASCPPSPLHQPPALAQMVNAQTPERPASGTQRSASQPSAPPLPAQLQAYLGYIATPQSTQRILTSSRKHYSAKARSAQLREYDTQSHRTQAGPPVLLAAKEPSEKTWVKVSISDDAAFPASGDAVGEAPSNVVRGMKHLGEGDQGIRTGRCAHGDWVVLHPFKSPQEGACQSVAEVAEAARSASAALATPSTPTRTAGAAASDTAGWSPGGELPVWGGRGSKRRGRLRTKAAVGGRHRGSSLAAYEGKGDTSHSMIQAQPLGVRYGDDELGPWHSSQASPIRESPHSFSRSAAPTKADSPRGRRHCRRLPTCRTQPLDNEDVVSSACESPVNRRSTTRCRSPSVAKTSPRSAPVTQAT